MSLTVTNIANALFKKLQGKSSTSDGKQFFEESRDGRPAVFQSQIVAQSDLIPTTAPGGVDQTVTGVVKRWIDLSLTPVAGLSNAFYSDSLKAAIPFNFGDGTYNYSLKDSTGTAIPFGSGDWIVDPDSGTVTFYNAVPANMPPKISFYSYVGSFGAVAAGSTFLELKQQATDVGAPAAGLQRIYLKSDGKAYTIDSTGAVKKLGSGGGGGAGKNYLADLYDGTSVTGFRLFNANITYTYATASQVDTTADTVSYPTNNVATGQAVVYTTSGTAIGGLTASTTYYAVRVSANAFGLATSLVNAITGTLIDLTSQGAGNHTFTFDPVLGQNLGIGGTVSGLSIAPYAGTSPLPLRPTSNQRISKTAASALGLGVSYDVALDPADYLNSFSLRFECQLRGSANYSASDLTIQVYDLSNNKPLKIATGYQKTLGSVKGIAYVPTAPTIQNIRIIVTVATTNANAWDLDLIDLQLDPLNLIIDHFRESALVPTVPPPGITQVYAKPNGKLYRQRSDGIERALQTVAVQRNYLEELFDGTVIAPINTFAQGATYTYDASANRVDTVGDGINYSGGSFFTGQSLTYTAATTAIGGLTTGATYYVVRLTATVFGLAISQQNANSKILIDLTSQGSGTQTFVFANQFGLGSGGTPAGLTQTIATALRANGNQRLAKDAANRQGMGWSYDLVMDSADTDGSKIMKLAFKYKTSANYAGGDIVVSLLDLTNNVQIMLDGAYNVPLTASLSATGFQSVFYATPGTSYRLVFTLATTSALAFTLDFIDSELGLIGGSAPGAIVTPWILDAPLVIGATGTAPTYGTVTLNRVWWRRVGENMQARYEFSQTAAGTAGTGDYLFPLPAGLQADLVKTTAYSTAVGAGQPYSPTNHIGTATMRASGTNHVAGATCVLYDATRFRVGGIGVNYQGSTSLNGGMFGQNFYGFNVAPIQFGIQIEVPIAGWTAGAQYSTTEVMLKQIPATNTSDLTSVTTSGQWLVMNNNWVDLQPGSYDLTSFVMIDNNGTSVSMSSLQAGFFAANGTTSTTIPASLTTLPQVTTFSSLSPLRRTTSNVATDYSLGPQATIKVSQLTRVYLVINVTAGAAANGRATVQITANKRPDYAGFGVYGQFAVLNTTSTAFAPAASGQYHALSGNSLTLPIGTWKLKPAATLTNNGTSPVYTSGGIGVFAANGANSATVPAQLNALTTLQMLSAYQANVFVPLVADVTNLVGPEYIVRVLAPTTVYGVTFANATTIANARITAYLTAERLQ